MVMVQHGEYFTVYANLRSTNVNTGQKVSAKDQIGVVGTDAENASVLKFFIWKGNNKLDPETWLYRR